MFKALVIWYNNKVASFLPSAIDTMKAELRHAEMAYLENQKEAEEAACQAEMWALKAKHDFKRCKRLQRWIDSEQESIDREKEEIRNAGLEAVMAEVFKGFAELDAAIAASEAEAQTKQAMYQAEAKDVSVKKQVEDFIAKNPLAMDDDKFMKAAAEKPAPKPSGFKADKETLGREVVAEKMDAQNLRKKDTDKSPAQQQAAATKGISKI